MSISLVGASIITLPPAKLQNMSMPMNAKTAATAPANSPSISSLGVQAQTAVPKPVSGPSNGVSLDNIVSLQSVGSLATVTSNINAAKISYGSSNYIDRQISYNSKKVNALNAGLGSLVDADLAKINAQSEALKIRQNLGTQAVAIANQAPESLLSLFRG